MVRIKICCWKRRAHQDIQLLDSMQHFAVGNYVTSHNHRPSLLPTQNQLVQDYFIAIALVWASIVH